MKDKVTPEKLEKYFDITTKGLEKAKENIIIGREDDAREITEMVENYVSDAHHFEAKQDFINAFAALNYAHGWLDAGVRLNVFDVDDDQLFTIK
jgi:hypothetical protein